MQPQIGGGAFNKPRGLNNLDANLDLAPFDSISNPNKSARETNPITRLAAQNRKVIGGNMRPEIDSFYNDRTDVRNK